MEWMIQQFIGNIIKFGLFRMNLYSAKSFLAIITIQYKKLMNQQVEQYMQVLQTEQTHKSSGYNLQSLKFDYLISEKQRLQIQLTEMTLNNQLLRKINYDIAKLNHIDMQSLIARNGQLENMLMKMFEENKQLRADIFLNTQVNLETQRQCKDFYENYQAKIKELRLLIQVKETNIQSLQSLISSKKWTVPTVNNVQIFESYEEIRQRLKQSWKNNDKLQSQNTKLKKQYEKVSQDLQKTNMLIASKCSFLQFRNLIKHSSSKSVPKANSNIQCLNMYQFERKNGRKGFQSTNCETKSNFKKNGESTFFANNSYQNQSNNMLKIITLNQIIKTKINQNKKLNQIIQLQNKKIQTLNIDKSKIIESNNIYRKQRIILKKKVNQHEQMIRVLFNYLTQRILYEQKLYCDDLAGEKVRVKNKLRDIQNKPELIRIEKQSWINMKNILEERFQNLRQFKRKKRSFSCVLDYIPNNHIQKEALQPQRFDEEQFSLCLEDSKFDGNDIEFVSGKTLKNYSKGKFKNNIKIQSVLFEDIDLEI